MKMYSQKAYQIYKNLRFWNIIRKLKCLERSIDGKIQYKAAVLSEVTFSIDGSGRLYMR